MLKISILIPNEFCEDFTKDRFKNCFERVIVDAEYNLKDMEDIGLTGDYEIETLKMLEQVFQETLTVQEWN